MNPRSVAASAATLTVLALAGCASAGSQTLSDDNVVTGLSSVSPAASSPPASQSPTAAETPAGDPGTTPAGGCSLIDAATASQILGGSATGTPATTIGTNDGVTKLDGCLYKAGGTTMGYDVVKYAGVDSSQLFARASAKAQRELAKETKAKVFDTTVPQGLGYTLSLNGGVNSQVATVGGDWFVTVAVARKDGDRTISEAAVNQAAAALLAAL